MDTTQRAIHSFAIRAILIANLSLFALFVIPTTHEWVDRRFVSLRSVNLESVVGHTLQVWIVASTIAATVLFGLLLGKNRRAELPVESIRFDGALLVTWWIALLGMCAYGFALGMGG